MESLLMDIGLKEGVFAVMFIALLMYVLKTSKDRENRLYNFLDNMKLEFAKLVGSYEHIAKDVSDIKRDMRRKDVDDFKDDMQDELNSKKDKFR